MCNRSEKVAKYIAQIEAQLIAMQKYSDDRTCAVVDGPPEQLPLLGYTVVLGRGRGAVRFVLYAPFSISTPVKSADLQADTLPRSIERSIPQGLLVRMRMLKYTQRADNGAAARQWKNQTSRLRADVCYDRNAGLVIAPVVWFAHSPHRKDAH